MKGVADWFVERLAKRGRRNYFTENYASYRLGREHQRNEWRGNILSFCVTRCEFPPGDCVGCPLKSMGGGKPDEIVASLNYISSRARELLKQ